MAHLESSSKPLRPMGHASVWETLDVEALSTEDSVSHVGKKGKCFGSKSSRLSKADLGMALIVRAARRINFAGQRDEITNKGYDEIGKETDLELPERRHSV